jgi:hypothetical protein
MKQKNYDYVPAMPGEFDFKDQGLKHNLSNHDYDLFKEEDDVITSVIRVKRVGLPNKGENWKITINNKLLFLIEGVKLSLKEKEFLRTVQGIQFIIQYSKRGWKSFNNFRQEMKTHLNSLK